MMTSEGLSEANATRRSASSSLRPKNVPDYRPHGTVHLQSPDAQKTAGALHMPSADRAHTVSHRQKPGGLRHDLGPLVVLPGRQMLLPVSGGVLPDAVKMLHRSDFLILGFVKYLTTKWFLTQLGNRKHTERYQGNGIPSGSIRIAADSRSPLPRADPVNAIAAHGGVPRITKLAVSREWIVPNEQPRARTRVNAGYERWRSLRRCAAPPRGSTASLAGRPCPPRSSRSLRARPISA